jgi:hypothetical protein
MHYINRAPFEYVGFIFTVKSFGDLIKANVNLTFFISLAGIYWFYRYVQNRILRNIISSWLLVCLFMYCYSTLVPLLHHRLHIDLPVTVPSFHYFFYLKALESVFFGMGLVYLLPSAVRWLSERMSSQKTNYSLKRIGPFIWVTLIILFSLAYYPIYSKRSDFTYLRELALQRESEKTKLEVYYFIKDHISPDKVILCELGQSMFPVMASGRKMVATTFTFSNPFVDFDQREKDRDEMLSYLVTGKSESDKQLFAKYQVSYILLSSSQFRKLLPDLAHNCKLVFRNGSFCLLSISV